MAAAAALAAAPPQPPLPEGDGAAAPALTDAAELLEASKAVGVDFMRPAAFGVGEVVNAIQGAAERVASRVHVIDLAKALVAEARRRGGAGAGVGVTALLPAVPPKHAAHFLPRVAELVADHNPWVPLSCHINACTNKEAVVAALDAALTHARVIELCDGGCEKHVGAAAFAAALIAEAAAAAAHNMGVPAAPAAA